MGIGVASVRSPATFGLLAMVAWGLWTFFTKLATRSGHPVTVMAISYAVAVTVGGTFWVLTRGEVDMTTRDLGFAVLAGLSTGLGSVLYYSGLDVGEVGRISTIVALYFVVSVVLGVLFLGETVTLRKAAGVGLGAVAVVLLTS